MCSIITKYLYENTVCSLANTLKFFKNHILKKDLLCESKTTNTKQFLHLPRKEDLSL